MNKKLTSALLCLFFAGCATVAPSEGENSESSSSVSSSSSSEVMMEAKAFSGTNTEIDAEKSSITFVGGSSIVDHDGEFTNFEADLAVDQITPSDLTEAILNISIDMTSAVTDSDGLNNHLQQEEFFDVENHPVATFTSTNILSAGNNMYEIMGDFTLKGTTKEMTISAEITDAYIKAKFDIPRKEFDIGNDSYGDKLLDDTVPVTAMLVFEKNMMMDEMDEDGMMGDDDSEMMDEDGMMMDEDDMMME